MEKKFNKDETLKVKGVAICLLLFHHLFYSQNRIDTNGGINLHIINSKTLTTMGTCARVCVWMFIFVSAYGLTKKYETYIKNSKKHFVIDCWLSLMKQYWFVHLLICFISFFIFKKPYEVYENNFIYYLLDFMGIADLFGTPTINGVFWYMCLAQIIIIMLPLLYKLCKNFGWSSILVVWIIVQFSNMNGISSNFGGKYINYIFITMAGIIFANKEVFSTIYSFYQKQGKDARILLGLFMLFIGILGPMINYRYSVNDKWLWCKLVYLVSALSVIAFIYLFISNDKIVNILKCLGKHSGNIFFIHSFTYMYYGKQIYASKNVIIIFIFTLAVSFFASVIIEFLKKSMDFNANISKMLTYKKYNDVDKFGIFDTQIHKGIAVLLLIGIHTFVHSDFSLYNYKYMVNNKPFLNWFFYNEKICVSIFCILSGYGLFKSFEKYKANISIKNTSKSFVELLKFSFTHWYKLMKNFWFIFVVFVILGIGFDKVSLFSTWGEGSKGVIGFIVDFLGIQDIVTDFWKTPTLNPTWWFMATIIVCYFSFPLLHIIVEKLPEANLVLWATIMVYSSFATHRQFKTGWVYYAAYFALGMYFARRNIFDYVKRNYKRSKFTVLNAFILVVVSFVFRLWNKFMFDWVHALAVMLFVEIAIVQCNANTVKKILGFIGDNSYNIFLIHTFFVAKYWYKAIYTLKNPLTIYLVVIIASLGGSVLLECFKRQLRDMFKNSVLTSKINNKLSTRIKK